MSWVSSLCTTSDAELISMGSGLALEIHHGVARLWEYGD